MKYAFHPEARVEFREAAAFYEARRRGLGRLFAREIERAIQKILQTPSKWRIIEQDVRRCLTRIFPYAVLYTVEEDSILVIAVAHGSREPGYWRHRFEGGLERSQAGERP